MLLQGWLDRKFFQENNIVVVATGSQEGKSHQHIRIGLRNYFINYTTARVKVVSGSFFCLLLILREKTPPNSYVFLSSEQQGLVQGSHEASIRGASWDDFADHALWKC